MPVLPERRWSRPPLSAAWGWAAAGLAGTFLGLHALAVPSLPPVWRPLVMAAALFPFLAMIVGDARRLLLAAILLDIPFPLQIHLGYRTLAAELGALGGLNLSVTTLCLAVLYALWIAELLGKGKGAPRPRFGQSWPLALYLAFAALSVTVAVDRVLSLYEVALLAQTFLLYLYLASTVRTRQDVSFVSGMLLLGLALEGLVILGNQFAGLDFTVASISTRADPSTRGDVQFSRAAGTVGSPILAASYLALLLAPAVGVLLTRLGRGHKALAVLALLFGGPALILTFSRGGWITLAVSTGILCFLAWRRRWLSPAVPLAIALGGAALALAFQDAIAVRLLDDVTARDRVPLMQLALRLIQASPLLGVGANNFSIAMLQQLTPEFDGAWLYTIHNKYLLVWAEAGLGALLAFLAFLFVTLRRGWNCWTRGDRLLSPIALALAAAILGQMIHMLVDVFHSRPQTQLLWLVAALITAMNNLDEEA